MGSGRPGTRRPGPPEPSGTGRPAAVEPAGSGSRPGPAAGDHPEPAEPDGFPSLPELIASLDRDIAPRLIAAHPADGWCPVCRATAPCSLRTLADAASACLAKRRP